MDISPILFIIRHFLVGVLIISGIALWMQRKVDIKPRICLLIFSFISALAIAYRLYLSYQVEVTTSHSILSISNLNCGFLELLLLYLYPIGVINPSRLTVKRIFLLFLPWLIICVAQIVFPIHFRDLSSFSDLVKHISEFNVWIRLVIEFVIIVPYTVMLLRIPSKWKKNNINREWIYRYVIGVQIMGLLFCISTLTGYLAIKSIHLFYSTGFCLYISYHELFVRLLHGPINAIRTKVTDQNKIDKHKKSAKNPLLEKLSSIMEEEEWWRDPDITLDDLAKHIHSNRTTLSTLIQQQGFSNYTEYINRHRIEAFLEIVKVNQAINIQEVFYEVGFRSKSTALRNFRQYIGCTPSEYVQQIRLDK